MSHSQVELALNTLYQTNIGPAQKEAEKFLVQYQKDPSSWPNSLRMLLTSASQTVQFFAAQSLYTNLHRDW
jgi:Importin-beta N-terminal domain